MIRPPLLRNGLRSLPGRTRSYVTDADIAQARKYCVNQLAQNDRDSYLIRQFVPRQVQPLYDALRTLNLELVRLPESVSNPTIGQMRSQFWTDSIDATFLGKPPREPICLLLRTALDSAVERSGSAALGSLRFWVSRIVKTRARYMDNRPFPTLATVEEYAEHTYSSLMYATLAGIPVRSMQLDHLASHIGKACGIVALLRGIPVLSAPSQQVKSPSGTDVGTRRQPVVLLPLDIMAEAGVAEEDVFRRGPNADGLRDAVFKVATRANDHLITARDMLRNLREEGSAVHDYEHLGEAAHEYGDQEDVIKDIRRGFGVLLEAIPASEYLAMLEKVDFDPFAVRSSWKLPWKIWQALKKQHV